MQEKCDDLQLPYLNLVVVCKFLGEHPEDYLPISATQTASNSVRKCDSIIPGNTSLEHLQATAEGIVVGVLSAVKTIPFLLINTLPVCQPLSTHQPQKTSQNTLNPTFRFSTTRFRASPPAFPDTAPPPGTAPRPRCECPAPPPGSAAAQKPSPDAPPDCSGQNPPWSWQPPPEW